MTAVLARGDEAKRSGIAPSSHEAVLGRDVSFAVRCLAGGLPVSPGLQVAIGQTFVDQLVARRGPGRFAPYRQRALGALALLAPGALHGGVARTLLASLDAPDPSSRATAAHCLGVVPLPDELLPGLEQALRDGSAQVRLAAVNATLQHGRLDLAETTIFDLLDADSPAVRRATLGLLEGQIPPSGIVGKVKQLLNDGDEGTRSAALVMLSRCSEVGHLSLDDLFAAVPRSLRTDALHTALLAVLDALRSKDRRVDDRVLDRASAGNLRTRRAAIQLLGAMPNSPRRDDVLASSLLDPATRLDAALTVTRLRLVSLQLVGALDQLLRHPEASVQRLAASCIAELSSGRPGQAASAADDVSPIAHALEQALQRCLRSEDEQVRLYGATAIAAQGDHRRARAALEPLAQAPTDSTRLGAITLLADIGDVFVEQVQRDIVDLMRSEDESVRLAAVTLTRRIVGPSRPLIQSVATAVREDPARPVRAAAATSLGMLDILTTADGAVAEHVLRSVLDRVPEGPAPFEGAPDIDAAWQALHDVVSVPKPISESIWPE